MEKLKNQISFDLKNKKNLIILIIAIIVVAALAAFFLKQTSNSLPLAEGCRPGDEFSQTTGEPCKATTFPPCEEGELFDRNTGQPCPEAGDKTAP